METISKEGISDEIAEQIYELLKLDNDAREFSNQKEAEIFLEDIYSIEKIKNWKDDYILTIWDKNILVGFGRGKKDGWITHVFVHPKYQSKGFGAKILSTLEQKLKDSGHTTLFLNAGPKAINFYKKYGWVEKVSEPIKYHGILLIPMQKHV